MRSFQHITTPLRLFHGPDSLGMLGRELDRLKSRRAVVFCGPWLAPESVPLTLIRSAMGERFAGMFTSVLAHSPVTSVEAAAAELQRLEADAVIAVGGGSVIVTARAASILLAEKRPARELATSTDSKGQLTSPKLLAPKLPQLVIPTTPTAACVKAGSAVLDEATGDRLALFDPKTRAQAIFVHPELIGTAPHGLVVSASLDTFSLALEGLTSRSGSPMSDAPLMQALRLIARHLRNPSVLNESLARGELVLAALLCGQGTDHTGAGIATVLGHAIGGRYGLENGTVKAVVLPAVLRFNGDASKDGVEKLADALGVRTTGNGTLTAAIVSSLETMFDALGTPRKLRDMGVPREALPEIAADAMKDWFLRGNPRPVREAAELQQVLEEAW